VYAHVYGGFATHIAESKLVEGKEDEYEPLGLPLAGKTFHDDTIEQCYMRLCELDETGYHVPKKAFERLELEMSEENEKSLKIID
jgi:hypothetical protein